MTKDRMVLPIVFKNRKDKKALLNRTKSFLDIGMRQPKKKSTVYLKPSSPSLIKLQPCKSFLRLENSKKLKKCVSSSVMDKLTENMLKRRKPAEIAKTPRYVKKKFVFKL